jgi:hypothetical protein
LIETKRTKIHFILKTKKMTLKSKLLGLFLILMPCLIYAQRSSDTMSFDSIKKILNQRFEGGDAAFFKQLSKTLRYPLEARENCRIGTVFVDLKIKPSGAFDSLNIKNEVVIGMGIEQEVSRSVFSTKGKWLKATEYSFISFSVGFNLGEGSDQVKDNINATIVVIGYSLPPSSCLSNKAIIKDFERAKKKNNKKEMLEACEELRRRMPNSEEYKKELALLKGG